MNSTCGLGKYSRWTLKFGRATRARTSTCPNSVPRQELDVVSRVRLRISCDFGSVDVEVDDEELGKSQKIVNNPRPGVRRMP